MLQKIKRLFQKRRAKVATTSGDTVQALRPSQQTKVLKSYRLFGAREFFTYVVFLVLFIVVTFISREDEHGFYFSGTMKEMLTKDKYTWEEWWGTFYDIDSMEQYWTWLETSFIPKLHQNIWYNGDNFTQYELGFVRMFIKKVGAIRLRQLRVQPDKDCSIPSKFEGSIHHCYGKYRPLNVDTSSFGPNNMYKYYSDSELQGGVYFGKVGSYNGGGYVLDLSSTNLTQCAEVLAEAKRNRWTDVSTRIVLHDVTVYNPSLNLFCVIRLGVEFTASGSVLPSSTFRTLNLYKYQTSNDYGVLAIELIFVVFVLYYIGEELWELSSDRLNYFKEFWNWIDMLNLLIFVVVIALRIASLIMIRDLPHPSENPEVYINYQPVAFIIDQERNFNAVNSILCWFKLFKYLNAITPKMNHLARTLQKAAISIITFLVMFFIVFFAYAQAGFMAFGLDVWGYKSIPSSIYTLFATLFGQFDFESYQATNRVIGPIFLITYMVLVFFVLMNMFLAIINQAYSEVQNEDKKLGGLLWNWRKFKDRFSKFFAKVFKRKSAAEIAREHLEAADRNNDRVLDKSEVVEFWQKSRESVSNAFNVQTAEQLLEKFDANKDGVLDEEETKKMKQLLHEQEEKDSVRIQQLLGLLPEILGSMGKRLDVLSERVDKLAKLMEERVRQDPGPHPFGN